MTLENTDKALDKAIDAINAEFPELAGKGYEAATSYIFYEGISGLLFAAFLTCISLFVFILSSKNKNEAGYLASFLGLSAAIILIVFSAPKMVSPDGFLVYQAITGVR